MTYDSDKDMRNLLAAMEAMHDGAAKIQGFLRRRPNAEHASDATRWKDTALAKSPEDGELAVT